MKYTKIFTEVKFITIAVLIFIFSLSAFYLNVKHEQNILLQQKLIAEETAAKQSNAVLDATKNIIKRDGQLNDKLAKQYAIWIFDSAAKYAVDPMLILSVIFIESKFNYKAVSPTGPTGLMQIAGYWHRDKVASSAELFDPKKNIQVGTQILKEYASMSNSTTETLLRYNGSLGKAPVYATKVIRTKNRYEAEVMAAMIKS